jgi:signal transduction histidine kinase
VVIHLDAKEFKGIGDRNRVMQIVLNLCTNAFQAMPHGGTLSVSTTNKTVTGHKYLVISVADTGTGISKDMQKKIYDPFFTTKEPGQGTGLGLSVVHGIIQDLGGTIELESKLKEGTTFRVMLPLSAIAKDTKS